MRTSNFHHKIDKFLHFLSVLAGKKIISYVHPVFSSSSSSPRPHLLDIHVLNIISCTRPVENYVIDCATRFSWTLIFIQLFTSTVSIETSILLYTQNSTKSTGFFSLLHWTQICFNFNSKYIYFDLLMSFLTVRH